MIPTQSRPIWKPEQGSAAATTLPTFIKGMQREGVLLLFWRTWAISKDVQELRKDLFAQVRKRKDLGKMISSVLSHKFLKDEIYLYLKPGFLTVSALIIWTVMNPHLLPPKPDATLTLCCSPKPMTSKTARFQKVPVFLFSTLKRKKLWQRKKMDI